ncbi:MAG: hypothetical protein JWP86_3001, partial [Phenylobacterium sp.]|nr:hypothetical protein [Phenylobacterium sp.]
GRLYEVVLAAAEQAEATAKTAAA